MKARDDWTQIGELVRTILPDAPTKPARREDDTTARLRLARDRKERRRRARPWTGHPQFRAGKDSSDNGRARAERGEVEALRLSTRPVSHFRPEGYIMPRRSFQEPDTGRGAIRDEECHFPARHPE